MLAGPTTPDVTVAAPQGTPPGAASGRQHVLVAIIAALSLLVTALVAYQWGHGQPRPRAVAAPSPSEQDGLTVAQIFQTVAPSVVFIRSEQTASTADSGTGVVINQDGTIMTAYHVVEGAHRIEVTFADGTTTRARVASSDPGTDIATLVTEDLPQLVVPAVLGGGAHVGDDVVAIGNQLSLIDSTTSGVVSGLDRTAAREGKADLKGLIQFDAAVNPGSSGGPLVDDRGRTIGIVVALANPTDAGTFIGVGFAVPIGAAVSGGRPPLI